MRHRSLLFAADPLASLVMIPRRSRTRQHHRTFKPPMYPAFALTRVGDTDVSFGSEVPSLSTWGNLDRISGSLSMNVMSPNERHKLQSGGSAHYMAFLTARCAPAQKMF